MRALRNWLAFLIAFGLTVWVGFATAATAAVRSGVAVVALLMFVGIGDAHATALCPAGKVFKVTNVYASLGNGWLQPESPQVGQEFTTLEQVWSPAATSSPPDEGCRNNGSADYPVSGVSIVGGSVGNATRVRADYAGSYPWELLGPPSCASGSGTTAEAYRFNAEGTCGDPAPKECPQAGTRVPRVVGGLCIGAACEGNMMEEMCTSTLDDPTKGCIAKPVDIAIRKGQLSVGHYEFTGGTCNPYGEEYPTDHPVSDDPSTGAKCTVDPNNGTSLCVEENSNCGTFNGERVCASEAPSTGQCKKLVSGGYLCVQGASTPPAPDNGEEGQPAQPDGQLKKPGTGNSSGNTYNYYNSSTVNNSTGEGPGGTTGGTTGGGDGEDDEGGFGSPGEGWPELDEVPTFSETNETFLEGLQGTSLGQAMLAAAEGVPDGTISCVPPSFEYQNEVYTFDAMCELWTGHASFLRSFFILGWALVAVVVFMRA